MKQISCVPYTQHFQSWVHPLQTQVHVSTKTEIGMFVSTPDWNQHNASLGTMPVSKQPSVSPLPGLHYWTHVCTKEVPFMQMQVLYSVSRKVRVCSHTPCPLQVGRSLWKMNISMKDDPTTSMWVFISRIVFSHS